MIKTMVAVAVLVAGTTTMAQAQHAVLGQGTQGRPHDGDFSERMLLRRHHLTRAQYNMMRRRHAQRASR